ncbi:MAG: cell division protein FtsZ [Chloroflexota bacterium]|nr:cell division protein FtsZ [Lentimicrobium sp.]
MLKFEMPKNQSSIIKVIGVGGGGSNAVTHMFKQGIRGVDFIICNTDCQALDTSPVPMKVQLGTKGLGAGSIPQVGREAANENIDQLRKILENNAKMVFITAGMGGGTGTGAAPVIAALAKELGILTVGIVTIPFSFEGRKRAQQARAGIDELRKSVDTLLLICNDKLRELEGDLKLSEAFGKADNILTVAAKGIAEIITVTGYINVDFEDVKTVMKDSGKAIMGSGMASGENRALEAVQMAMTSPLLDDANIRGASNILLYISSGSEEITLDEVMEITDYIQHEAGSSADIIWGNGTDETLGDKISITLIATGFDSKLKGTEDSVNKIIHPLNAPEKAPELTKETITKQPVQEIQLINSIQEDQITEITKITLVDENNEKKEDQRVYTFDLSGSPVSSGVVNDSSLANSSGNNQFNGTVKIEPVVAAEKKTQPGFDFLRTFSNKDVETKQEERFKDRTQKLEEMSHKIKTPEGLLELEKQPAYLRKKIELTDPAPSSETEISRYTLFKNENGVEMKQNNSFLHDNVD